MLLLILNAVTDLGRNAPADISEENWNRSIAVNFTGVFLCMNYEIHTMLNRGGGAIVNVGSGNEFGCAHGLAWYLGAKHGLYEMTKVAALDYAMKNIRVNTLGRGVMVTPLMAENLKRDPNHKAFVERSCPTGSIAQPENVAEAAVWLCSNAVSFVVGHTMVVDGGIGLV